MMKHMDCRIIQVFYQGAVLKVMQTLEMTFTY